MAPASARVLLAPLLSTLFASAAGQDPCATESILPPLSTYDIAKVPRPASGGPLEVAVMGTVTKINEFSTKLQTFRLNMYFRQQWTDERLRWNASDHCGVTQLSDIPSSRIWVPDTFFASSNEIKRPDGEEYVRVNEDGQVLWSKRIVLNLFCAMDFTYYPFDEQTCVSDVESYAYSPDDIVFIMPDENDAYTDVISFLNNDPKVGTVASYTLNVPTSQVSTQEIGENRFSQVKYTWTFTRKKGRFVLTNMTQLWLVVAMSFMGLFINLEVAPARVAIALISVLTCMNILNRLLGDIPVVPYITGMDWLYLITSVFVVANVAEYCAANYVVTCLNRRDKAAGELKRRRHGDFAPSSRASTETDMKLARAELRELFNLFDTGRDGVLTRNECCALIMSAAADRARSVDKEAVRAAVDAMPQLLTYSDLAGLLLGGNALAEKVGLSYEPKGAVLLAGAAYTKSDVEKAEGVYRVWAPLFYVYANMVWFIVCLSKGEELVTCLVSIPIGLILIAGFVVSWKKAYALQPVTSGAGKQQVGSQPPSPTNAGGVSFSGPQRALGQPLLEGGEMTAVPIPGSASGKDSAMAL